MLRKIWRWLKEVLENIFSATKTPKKITTTAEEIPLTDLDYEFLFNQLLVGVGHGWHEGRIVKFFQQLENRSREKDWVEWLDRFSGKVMPNAANNQQLGAVMMRLGELTQSIPSLYLLGDKSYHIGRAILTSQTNSQIWEYAGPDATLAQTESLTAPSPPLNIESKIPENAEEWFELGLKQADAGMLAEAIASWDEALKLDPNLDSVWHNRGAAFGQLGQLEAAIQCFEQAIAINAESIESWHDQALALSQLEKWEEALTNWNEFLRLVPDNFQGWYNQGFVLERLGKIEEAIAAYNKALEINPDFELAQNKLQDLKQND